jgi:hypothetical protein
MDLMLKYEMRLPESGSGSGSGVNIWRNSENFESYRQAGLGRGGLYFLIDRRKKKLGVE